MSDGNFDVIVIGVGGMGSAALFELARRGRKVLGLEQFPIGHDLGSSHGQTRIIRTAYYEHPAYVPLVRSAFERWYELEQRQGQQLLTECGLLSIGLPDGEMVRGLRTSAQEHHIPVEYLTADEVRRRFPQFRVGQEHVGVLEGSAGFLYVERCVLAHVHEAEKLGAVVRAQEPVVSWEATSRGVSVQTVRGHYTAAKLVITAGPWATHLLEALSAGLTVMRQVALWFATQDDRLFGRRAFPLYIVESPEGVYYGFPVIDSSEGMKTAQHYGAPELRRPADIDRTVRREDEEPVRRFLRQFLPQVDGPRRRASVCTYTLTPDRHFLIDRHPHHPNVALAAGFSGHGFKFSPVVGEILADLAENGRTNLPVEMFGLRRSAPS
jgi:sarcosine oxidase